MQKMEEDRKRNEENRLKKESRVVVKGVHPQMKIVAKPKMDKKEDKKNPYTED